MKFKLMAGTAAGAIVLAGFGITTVETEQSIGAEVPFIHPLVIARAQCGENVDELSQRRKFFVRAATAYAKTQDPTALSRADVINPDLGAISYSVTTENDEAQAWFNQGLAFTYNFNHGEAINAFKRAQAADPDCAMCYWGEAFAYGPNINAPMSEDANEPAYAAYKRAFDAREYASDKEKALINALGYRYSPAPPADRSKLDNAFADAMDDVTREYPDDDFIAAFAAEANMDTQVWDYWENSGRTPKGRTARTISLLEGILARNPNYTAAIHLYIHITEASSNPYRAADHADRLASLTPGLGHLIHMPSHTYYRIGRFKTSLDHNIQAVNVDAAYLEGANASVLYEFGYYTHNIHFAMTSAQMAGDGETALVMAKRLDAKLPIEMAAAAPFVQPIKAAPYYAMVQYGDPADILMLEKPDATFPFLQGAWHYARGEALAAQGNMTGAQAEAEAISKIVSEADLSALIDGGVPALDILNIARLTVIAREAQLSGDLATAIEAMEEAVAIQNDIAYTEPPYWYYPAKQTLAALLLQQGEAERAEQLFLEALTESPNNAMVLFGLAQTYKAQGDKSGAKYAKALFSDAWAGTKKSMPTLNSL